MDENWALILQFVFNFFSLCLSSPFTVIYLCHFWTCSSSFARSQLIRLTRSHLIQKWNRIEHSWRHVRFSNIKITLLGTQIFNWTSTVPWVNCNSYFHQGKWFEYFFVTLLVDMEKWYESTRFWVFSSPQQKRLTGHAFMKSLDWIDKQTLEYDAICNILSCYKITTYSFIIRCMFYWWILFVQFYIWFWQMSISRFILWSNLPLFKIKSQRIVCLEPSS